MTTPEIKEYPHCFGCGQSNPIGLGLSLKMEDGHLTTEFVPQEGHQGWPGIVHGGVIASLLYEVLENLAYYQGVLTMTRSMETRYRRPAPAGKRIVARSWLVDRGDRDMNVSATLTGEGGEVLAEGNAVLVVMSQRHRERLGLARQMPD